MSIVIGREKLARLLATLFLSASLMAGVAGAADAAPVKFCKRNPENYSFYKGKCLSDKRIEVLKERAERETRG